MDLFGCIYRSTGTGLAIPRPEHRTVPGCGIIGFPLVERADASEDRAWGRLFASLNHWRRVSSSGELGFETRGLTTGLCKLFSGITLVSLENFFTKEAVGVEASVLRACGGVCL